MKFLLDCFKNDEINYWGVLYLSFLRTSDVAYIEYKSEDKHKTLEFSKEKLNELRKFLNKNKKWLKDN